MTTEKIEKLLIAAINRAYLAGQMDTPISEVFKEFLPLLKS